MFKRNAVFPSSIVLALLMSPAVSALAQDAAGPATPSVPPVVTHNRKPNSAQVSAANAAASAGKLKGSDPSQSLALVTASMSKAMPKPPAASAARLPSAPSVAPAPAVPPPPAIADFATEAPKDQAVQMKVGRSIFLTTKHRLARVYITNPAVLESYTASANQVVLTSKIPGVSSVILWDESGEEQDYLVSSEADIDMLKQSLQEAMPNSPIRVQQSEGRIMIAGTVGTDADSEAAVKLANAYSKDVSNALLVDSAKVRQVELKVRIIEVDRSKANQFAFNFFNSGNNIASQTTTSQYSSTPTITSGGSSCSAASTTCKTVSVSNALNYFLFSNKLNIGATIQDLETMQLLQILAEPNITALSGHKANFLVGGEFPFPVVSNAGGVANVTIQFRPYGVKLEFTPKVNNDGTIDLIVAPEVSALDYANAVTISGFSVPAISTRRAETRVVLNSGQTFAIAGLLDQRSTDLFSKTPGIASVPLLGELFKSKNVTRSRQELMVIVTPTLVDIPPAAIAPSSIPVLPAKMLEKQEFDTTIPNHSKK